MSNLQLQLNGRYVQIPLQIGAPTTPAAALAPILRGQKGDQGQQGPPGPKGDPGDGALSLSASPDNMAQWESPDVLIVPNSPIDPLAYYILAKN